MGGGDAGVPCPRQCARRGSSREEHLNAAAGLGGAAAQRRPIGYLSAARFKLETSWAIYAVTLSCQRLEEEENMSLRSAPS